MKLTKYLNIGGKISTDSVSDQKVSSKNVRKVHKDMVDSEPFSLTNDEIEELVLRAKNGDVDAFGGVYDHYVDQIYKYVYFRVPAGEAEDITETVFMKAWEKIYQYKPKKKGFGAWLFRIAHNLIVDSYRSAKDRDVSELDENIPEYRREHNPVKMTEDVFHSEVLRKALSKIHKNYRQIIVLKFINELSNEEIAKVLGKREGSVRILQFRALKELRVQLEEFGVDLL
ncbi:MAG TPA: sigma-70 family RNA polymerase sigma factor [Candidatus Gracilibacteria bacterium]|nr:sigma-70 family RNA polymerase sigma factor [Candidatus Gracilibacteria bacterium]